MASLGMGNSYYDLTVEEVDRVVEKGKIGNYALGYQTEAGFRVKYVGRSDNDLNDRIKDHIGEKESHKQFKFSYAKSVKEAFEKECNNWHDFGEDKVLKDNEYHPDKPNGTEFKCPKCGQ